MNIKLSDGVLADILAAKNALAQAIVDRLDAGSGPAEFRFYTGTQPAGPGTAITGQTLLGTATCSSPCATISAGVITFDAITDDSATDASGVATWVRACDSTGAGVIDGDVSDNAGTGFAKLNTTTVAAGGPLRVLSAVLTVGG